MGMKNAVAVCLISLFSATLVLLIARALDLQTASRLEPQLTQIVEELRAIRKSGGISTGQGGASESEAVGDGLAVYYFHGNVRCPTCVAIESQSKETVFTDYAPQLKVKEMSWSILNYEEPAAATLKNKFNIIAPVVVLARIKAGKIEDWKRLDKVWALWDDKAAFAKYLRDEIDAMLKAWKVQSAQASRGESAEMPVPGGDAVNIPVPESTDSIPVPQ